MPEYRRFVSYFYEYIDGKKQKNTGFAKVELRNGVWRLLFRLTVSVQPGSPVEVFGFMREGEKLKGLPMGTMRAAREMTEEWAYRADEPVWMGKYGLSDISGLWIQSGDGRCFATVWDDEPVDPAQFMRYEVQDEKQAEAREGISGQAEVSEEAPEQAEARESALEQVEMREDVPEQAEGEETVLEQLEVRESMPEGGEAEPERSEVKAGVPEQAEVREDTPEQVEARKGMPESTEKTEELPEKYKNADAERRQDGDPTELEQGAENPEDDRLWKDLYRKRAGFQPFSDQEISSCIRVVPGDIVVLQNAHWRTGRNNFLLHGYHNYRHLLIGRNSDGGYVLGVPGIMNPQEKYMASMFGFPNFKYADDQESGTSFGYWYRFLEREDR